MKGRNEQHKYESWAGLVTMLAVSVLASGCGSPPAAGLLIRAAQEAIEAEAQHLAADCQRDRQEVEHTRQTLTAAMEADVRQAAEMDVAWVIQTAQGYAAAVEALARHEMTLAAERKQRAENLRAAIEAQERAIRLIQKQDELVAKTFGLDLWRLGKMGQTSQTEGQ